MLAFHVVLNEFKLARWDINHHLVDCTLTVQDKGAGVGSNVVGCRSLAATGLHGSTLLRVVVNALCDFGIVLAHGFKDHIIQQFARTVNTRITLWLLPEAATAFRYQDATISTNQKSSYELCCLINC